MTTSAVTAPRALTEYLRRATWGLPPARQQELWDELEEHVLTRTDHLTLTGLSPTQAMTQAIRELGPPARVTLGMAKVYTMPKLLLAAGTLALAVSAGLYALAGGGGHTLNLPVLTNAPVKPSCVRGTAPIGDGLTIVSQQGGITCYTFKAAPAYEGAYLSLSGIRAAVGASGGRVEERADGSIRIVLQGSQINLPPNFTVAEERYFLAAAVASSLYAEQMGNAVLSGYARPTLRLGETVLNFGDGSKTGFGKAFYRGLALELLGAALFDPSKSNGSGYSVMLSDPPGPLRHRIQTGLKAGEVVLLATRSPQGAYVLDSAPVAADGSVTMDMPYPTLKFVASPALLSPTPTSGRVNALLVRVTNIPLSNLKSGIFVPAQPTSDVR